MQPGFTSDQLKVSSSDGRNFVLLEDFAFVRPCGEVVTVPAGTTSDGASTPRGMWNIIPPFGKYWRAAFLHDFLYRSTTRPKAECDTILNEAMELSGVEECERIAIYEGVHLGGQAAFDEDRRNQPA